MKMKARLLFGSAFIAAVAVRRRPCSHFCCIGRFRPEKGILMRGRNRRFELSMSCKPSGFSSFFFGCSALISDRLPPLHPLDRTVNFLKGRTRILPTVKPMASRKMNTKNEMKGPTVKILLNSRPIERKWLSKDAPRSGQDEEQQSSSLLNYQQQRKSRSLSEKRDRGTYSSNWSTAPDLKNISSCCVCCMATQIRLR